MSNAAELIELAGNDSHLLTRQEWCDLHRLLLGNSPSLSNQEILDEFAVTLGGYGIHVRIDGAISESGRHYLGRLCELMGPMDCHAFAVVSPTLETPL